MSGIARFLNALDSSAAEGALRDCCGSHIWVDAMVAARPFDRDETVLTAADRFWFALRHEDWLEAFAQHPRIGQPSTSRWSQREQSGILRASPDLRARMIERNQEYEARFGHVFLICATGRSAEEMLTNLESRLSNDVDTELHVAAAEQAKILALRLHKLVDPRDR